MNKVSQLLIAPDGYTCTGVTGRLKVKYPRSEFSKGNKGGSVQRCVFQDIENTEIKVCFWNIPEVPYAEEDWICIMPTQGKNGSVGLTVKDNEYKGNVTKELHVSEKASVATSEEPEGNEEVEEVALQSQDSGEEEIISTSDQDTDEDTTSLPVALVQNMNLMNLCLKGAGLVKEKHPNMTDDQFQAITSCFFIECNKQNLGKKMPSQLL